MNNPSRMIPPFLDLKTMSQEDPEDNHTRSETRLSLPPENPRTASGIRCPAGTDGSPISVLRTVGDIIYAVVRTEIGEMELLPKVGWFVYDIPLHVSPLDFVC